MCPSDERKEMAEKPVGERPQDWRSKEDVIKERDAKHLSDEIPETTSGVDDLGDAPDSSMRTGKERRMRGEGQQAKSPDGKPYGHDWDPDSRDDHIANSTTGRGTP